MKYVTSHGEGARGGEGFSKIVKKKVLSIIWKALYDIDFTYYPGVNFTNVLCS